MTEEWIIDESELQYLEKLGAGVCGEVYRVTLKTEDGRTIDAAAKIFRENQESDTESQKKELNFLRQLKHPNIVEFFCAVLFPITIIVTEFAAKGSLYEYLKRQIRLPVHHMLEWARQASSAVQYLQKENVVHRDIKSSNFVITADDTLKLCDFGIAKRQYRTEKTNHESGTIPWMAPEAIEKLTSKASDIYSLGIVIWELLSCEIPYQGKEGLAILYAVKVHKLRPDIPPHCPPALKDLLERCWKENRKKRPDIDEVLRTIEALIQKQHEHDKVKFYNKHGKREIYHLYQQHVTNENEQNALTEHVIPMDNGMTGSSFANGFETDRSFNHVDINGNVSSAERGMKGRHIRFIFAFIFIALAVVGLAAGLACLVTTLKDEISCTNNVIPRIDNAIFNCKDVNGSKYWSCEGSCEDGFEWKGESNVIRFDRENGHWNINISENVCSLSASMITQGPIPTESAANRSDENDVSSAYHTSLSQTSPFPSSETETFPSKTASHQKNNVDVGHVTYAITNKYGTDPRASTKLPQEDSATTLGMSLSESANNSETGAIYRVVISSIKNPDRSYNGTIYREGNYTKSNGSVDICISGNCTNVNFPLDAAEVHVRFFALVFASDDSDDLTNFSIMLANPQNGEIESNSSTGTILYLEFENAHVTFSVVRGL